jgi:protease-4
VGQGSMGMAMAQEYLDALEEFKKSGKFVYSYIETGSEAGYMLALPSDKIYMSSEGICELNGFGTSTTFYKGLLDKIGVEFHVKGFEDFKSAGEGYVRKNYSDSARYQLKVLLGERFEYYLDLVSKYRKIDREEVRDLLNEGVYSADDYLEHHLVDSLISETTVKEILKDRSTKDVLLNSSEPKLNLVSVCDYLESEQKLQQSDAPKDKQIAIIFASGTIIDDNGKANMNDAITPSSIIKSLKSAREDESVKAIILRIDSPGGSVMASEAIREEIEKTKKIKPVYASMSDVAASGGYYIAMPCDTIIASEHTITGSIGVISMFPNISKLMGKLDLSVDTISTGAASQDLNIMLPFGERQKNKLNAMMERTYHRFVDKVATARKKSFEEAHALAKGRVWSGMDAKEHGLVDTMGGIMTAIDIAKRRIGLAESQKVRVREYPEHEGEWELILKLLKKPNQAETGVNYSAMAQYFGVDQNQMVGLFNSLPPAVRKDVLYSFQMLAISQKEYVLVACPNLYEIK